MKLIWPVMLAACLINSNAHGMWEFITTFNKTLEESSKKDYKRKHVYPKIFETKTKQVTFDNLIYARIPLPNEDDWERITLVHSYCDLANYTIELQRKKVLGNDKIPYDYVEFSRGYSITPTGKKIALVGGLLVVAYGLKLALTQDEL